MYQITIGRDGGWISAFECERALAAEGTFEPLPGPSWLWRSHPMGVQVPFTLRDGEISVTDPDEAVISVVVAIGARLGAHLRGAALVA